MTFVELLKKAEQELYPGCSEFSTLSFIVNLLHLKVYNKWSTKSFDMMLKLLKRALPNGETLPKSYYDAKKVLNDLGLGYIAIHAYSNTQKSVRGPTRGIALRKLNKKNKDKLIIHIDSVQRRPIDSVESAKLSSELGQISRESLPVPNKWKNFKKTELMTAFTQLDSQELEFEGDEVDRIKFHKHTHYTEGKGWITPQSENNHINLMFVELEFKRLSFGFLLQSCLGDVQKIACLGANFSTCLGAEIAPVLVLKQYLTATVKHQNGAFSVFVQVEMEKRRIDAETRDEVVDVDKIVDDVLGKRSSYIVGLGYGPKPNKSSSGMRILQETLKEKDRECAELREERATLMEEMNAMKSTLAERTHLFEKLVQSQNLNSWMVTEGERANDATCPFRF
ncbi:hypothetical protein BUALT_Bualt18G0047200 [Buddleja alternifolia]|uniref:Uncharacterized protein n=1 Tax=Buddleja alternifolia TaxID=168488 RepID=A0AAV6WAH6_9LAMI|nr:hypothetical protein BUALT_Bualt18G0047200 [Buddleja alternifolia]